MSKERDLMIQKLKIIVIPYLKYKCFTGNFPHFRRICKNRIDLITFQFDKYGGGFVVEIAKCPNKIFVSYWGKKIPQNKITAHDLHPNERLRLRSKISKSDKEKDYWFRYDKWNLFGNIFDKLTKKVIRLIETQAEPYWNENKLIIH
jgi:hypothetical protein